MAQYLIIHESGETTFAEGKNIKDAARPLIEDGETVKIYRVAAPGVMVTATVSQIRSIEVCEDPGEET